MDRSSIPQTGGTQANEQQQNQNEKSQEEQLQQQKERQEDFKNQVLNQVLDQQARARLATLSLAKPEKAQAVESLLINMARMGRLGMGSKVSESQLIDILEKVGSGGMAGGGGSSTMSGSVSFSRRRTNLNDSDDDEDEYNKIMEDL